MKYGTVVKITEETLRRILSIPDDVEMQFFLGNDYISIKFRTFEDTRNFKLFERDIKLYKLYEGMEYPQTLLT